MLNGVSLPILGLLFLAAAVVVWVASSALSTSATRLADHLRLGQALAGQLLLATVEDLPEVVIVVAGSLAGHLGLVTGNLLGGIAAQTVLLAAIDAAGVRDRPLSYRATSLQLVLVGLQGVLVLGIVIMATQLPPSLHLWRLDPGSVAIFLTWLGTTWLLKRAQAGLPWRQEERAPLPPEVARAGKSADAEDRTTSLRRTVVVFAASALAILASGYVLEAAGSRLAAAFGIGGLVFGATILALITGLPEFVTGFTASRRGDFAEAVSEVFGSNTFLPVLFLPAALLTGRAVLAEAGPAEVYLTGLGLLMTTAYLWGLLFRPSRQYLRLGPDSIAVLLIYLAGIAGLAALAR